MTTIGYNDIENVLLSLQDPNTWSAVTSVPWVNSPKINAVTSVYNEQWWGSWIAWWSTNVNWYASDYNTVSRWSGSVYLPDWTALTVSSWNTGNMSSTTYIYYDREDNTVKTTTSASSSVWEKKILLCVAAPTSSWKDAEFQAFWTDKQSTFITADNIAANTITGNEIAANSITAYEMDVSQLSAISANLWTITAWDISGTTITAGSTGSAAVKLYPYSSSQGRVEFYYGGSVIWYIYWSYDSDAWGSLMRIQSNNSILLDWTTYVIDRNKLDLTLWKLKIPVWDNLY